MSEQLFCYATDESAVRGLIGLGLRDPELAERCYARILQYATDEPLRGWDNADLAVRSLLWRGDPLLPMDGHPDSYWHALEAIVAALAVDYVEPTELQAASDLDEVASLSRVPDDQLPRNLTRLPQIDLPPAHDIYIRVIPRPQALAFFQTWLANDDGQHAYLTQFALNFTRPKARRVGAPDFWLVSPGTPLQQSLNPEWPPGPAPSVEIPECLTTSLSKIDHPGVAANPALDERLREANGHYQTGDPASADGMWLLQWRREDGLVRLINERSGRSIRHWYARLEHCWRDEFELAAIDAGIGTTQSFRAPQPSEMIMRLKLGPNRVNVPQGVAQTNARWGELFRLLDAVIATMAGPEFPWGRAEDRFIAQL